MGLDVGVMTFQYLEKPDDLLYDFLWHLHWQTSFDNEVWQVSEGMNTILEIERLLMLKHATEFVSEDKIDEASEKRIFKWIEDLPWDEGGGEEGDDVIALHLSW